MRGEPLSQRSGHLGNEWDVLILLVIYSVIPVFTKYFWSIHDEITFHNNTMLLYMKPLSEIILVGIYLSMRHTTVVFVLLSFVNNSRIRHGS